MNNLGYVPEQNIISPIKIWESPFSTLLISRLTAEIAGVQINFAPGLYALYL